MNTLDRFRPTANFLMHHGVLGQKWGIRRYQNYDGTLIRRDESKTIPVKRKTLKAESERLIETHREELNSLKEASRNLEDLYEEVDDAYALEFKKLSKDDKLLTEIANSIIDNANQMKDNE